MSKMKAPLNMGDNISKAEAFMDILGEAAQRKKDNKSRLCFMYDTSFDESKRFNRFVTENRNALSNFLIKHFVLLFQLRHFYQMLRYHIYYYNLHLH